jgi:hypothetical protein
MNMFKVVVTGVLALIAGFFSVMAVKPVNTAFIIQGEPLTVQSVDLYLNSLKSSSDPERGLQYSRLEKLMSGTLPAVVLRDGILRNSSNGAVYIDSDVNSLAMLESAIPPSMKPEMLLIRVEQPNEILSNPNISQKIVSRVKYIYFLCGFKPCETPGCESALLIRMVPGNADPAPVLLFRVSVAN